MKDPGMYCLSSDSDADDGNSDEKCDSDSDGEYIPDLKED
jgi:hypothetical protein